MKIKTIWPIVTIKEYGPHIWFKVVEELKGYDVPMYLVEKVELSIDFFWMENRRRELDGLDAIHEPELPKGFRLKMAKSALTGVYDTRVMNVIKYENL